MYSPSILIVNFTGVDFVTTTVSSLIGVSMLAMAIECFLMGPLAKWQRAATLIGGLLMIHVGILTDVIGAVILLGIIGTQWGKKKKGA